MYTLHSCAIIFAVESHAHMFCHSFANAVNMTRISKHVLASASSDSRHETGQDPSQIPNSSTSKARNLPGVLLASC